MKKSFTLVEVLISITLFMLILLFLYKVLDDTKYSNKLFAKKEAKIKLNNSLYNIFLEDIGESKKETNFNLLVDKEKNSILKIKSNNTYHNVFFNNITYLVNSNNKLVRIESKKAFETKKSMGMDFYKNAYIDVLVENIEYFNIVKSKDKSYLFIIKEKNKEKLIYNTFRF